MINLQLLICRRSALQNRVDVFHFLTRPQRIENVVNKVEQLKNQISHRHFLLLAKIDHLTVESPTHRAPLVFLNQHAPVKPKAEILLNQHVEFCDNRLKQSSDGNRVVDPRGNVANAKLKRGEKRMRANVTPDFLDDVDAFCFDQPFDITLKTAVRIELIGT